MGNIFATYKTYILAIAGVLVAVVAWWSLSGDDVSSNAVLTTQGAGRITTSNERDIVDTLLQLRAVSLSGTILSDPGFSSLKDFGTQIILEPVGRENPFAPIGQDATNPVSTSTPSSEPQL